MTNNGVATTGDSIAFMAHHYHQFTSVGSLTNAYSFRSGIQNAVNGWTLTNHYDFKADAVSSSGGTITNRFAYRCDADTTSNTNPWCFYNSSSTAKNLFAGESQFGDNVRLTTAGKSIEIKTGSNACAGSATLSAGAATVSTTCIGTLGTNTIIQLTQNGSSTGVVRISASTANTDFTITSSDGASTNTVYWTIIKIN